MKSRRWIVFLIVVAAALLLSGCGVNREGVDVTQVPPEGFWQTFVVWPLAKALIKLDEFLVGLGVRYSWGFAIILFTLIIKVITLPLTITQIRGMQAQRELQPKIQELQKKYGKDREKLSQEQMKLYQEAGVNPLSGCLPLLVQMPILFGLYSALVTLGDKLDEPFFWIPSLAFPEYTGGLSWIPQLFQAGDYYELFAYLVLPVLLVVSQFIMQKWMTPATPDSGGAAAGMTKQIGLMMTFMFGFFTLQVPAGLTLYWVTSNFLQMGQQWFITDRMTRSTATTSAGGNGVSAETGTVSTEAETVAKSSQNGDGPAQDKATKKPKRRRSKRR